MGEIVWEDENTRIICGDVLEVLGDKDLVPRNVVQMAMTSVPYLRQRKYPAPGSWGWEERVGDWLKHMHDYSVALQTVLKQSGVYWFNSGDKWGGSTSTSDYGDKRFNEAPDGFKNVASSKLQKDKINRKGNLMMLPERVVVDLIDNEIFTLINKCVWWKPNRAVQSYTRKLVDTWEPVYLLAKDEEKYKWNRSKIGVEQRGELNILSQVEKDEDAEPAPVQMIMSHDQPDLWTPNYDEDHPPPFGTDEYREWYNGTRAKQAWHDHKDDASQGQRFGRKKGSYGESGHAKGQGGSKEAQHTQVLKHPDGSNPGDVWAISIKADPFFKKAGIPPQRMWPVQPNELFNIPLLATTDEGDVVLDPFCGSGSLGVAAKQLGRKSILIDIDKDSCRIAALRVMKAQAPLKGKQNVLL